MDVFVLKNNNKKQPSKVCGSVIKSKYFLFVCLFVVVVC